MSDTHPSTLLSPIDSRYQKVTRPLSEYLSDYAFVKYRLLLEIEYLIALAKTVPELLKDIPPEEVLRGIYQNFSTSDFDAVKAHELKCNHDVKAIEYFLRDHPAFSGNDDLKNGIHFALTSQDINNTAIVMMLRDSIQQVYLPGLKKIIGMLESITLENKTTVMLSRTHGQAATPTTMGKEIRVFSSRLAKQIQFFENAGIYQAKFSGTVGNFNAHIIAYPHINWPEFADNFTQSLGLSRQQCTTQISNYDDLAEIFHRMSRINTILIDLSTDIWAYISLGYFKLRVVADEVGSSVMPHKVNPINFENAEGNLGMANALFTFFAQKLPVSRLQRDLSDSTVLRNVSIPMAHTIIAFDGLTRGLNKLLVNKTVIDADLSRNWCVVTEGIQTILRRERVPDPYALLKDFSRGRELGESEILAFIQTLPVSDHVRAELSAITPFNYTGNSCE